MDALGERTGRRYRLFDYVGHPQAERVLVLMGSGAEVAHETVEWLAARGERVGVLKVRLFRPFDVQAFARALPPSVRRVAVLDRTKEPGALGEPLLLDVIAALHEARRRGLLAGDMPLVTGGRYGLSSKEFDPAMVKGVLDELAREEPRAHFTIGIVDDVTHLSLPWPEDFDIEDTRRTRAVFWGLGSDGTVGAYKNSIKIIGGQTEHDAQGYYVYDSKKSGAVTVSHLRFGPGPIRSSYLVRRANFVACHRFELLERNDVLACAERGATVLLNAPCAAGEVWERLPREVQRQVLDRELALWVIDADAVAQAAGLGGRVNVVMQTCFFALSGVLPRAEAIACIKRALGESYGKKGADVVRRNEEAVDATLARLQRVETAGRAADGAPRPPAVAPDAPEFVRRVTAALLAGHGDRLPVSAFPPDGTWPTGTARWEKRNIAREIPAWDAGLCIQCNKCAEMCPHAAIRAKAYPAAALAGAPASFLYVPYRGTELAGAAFTIQVAPEDCTGCGLCVAVCPARDKGNPRHKAIDMAPQAPRRAAERANFEFFLSLPEADRAAVRPDARGVQFLQPLFEFSGACAGCGETPYLKLLSQLFGDRLLVANATGCSSIYGGNLPTTPWTTDAQGRGPAWANSLFEDNAEFGLGLRLAADGRAALARALVGRLAGRVGEALAEGLLKANQDGEAGIREQRARVVELRRVLATLPGEDAARLALLADDLVQRTVWIVGGDGWAYDIGFGGLDHVLSLRHDVNVLVLDTEVYSNTGGQASKATPLGAAAKFAAAGKEGGKKDLGLMAMAYGHVYVARVALGARDTQTLRALQEAESWHGPSLVIAYSPCIAHGYDLVQSADQAKLAVDSAAWPLYRFDPRRREAGQPPLVIDSGPPRARLRDYMRNETRFRMVERRDPQRFARLIAAAERQAAQRMAVYQQLATVTVPAFPEASPEAAGEPAAAG
jgi:pyruvate-ferredoxin/flavodoxin oxidoreductase